MPTSLSFLFWNKVWPPTDPQISFPGKTILITGGNTGLGYSVAVKVIEKGCTDIVLAVRGMDRGEAAKDKIIDWTGCDPSSIKVWQVDQKSFASVRAFAQRVSTLPKLDIVVLNAGVLRDNYYVTDDGWEEMMQVNALSTALLAILLLPKLAERAQQDHSAKPHMCFVSSSGVLYGDRERLKVVKGAALATASQRESFPTSSMPGRDQYELTKLIGEYAKLGVARLITAKSKDGPPAVVVNSAYSGSTFTEISRDQIKDSAVKKFISTLILRTGEQGARSIVSALALGDDSHGKWWWNNAFADRGPNVDSPEGQTLQEQIWAEILEVLVRVAPEVKDIVAGNF